MFGLLEPHTFLFKGNEGTTWLVDGLRFSSLNLGGVLECVGLAGGVLCAVFSIGCCLLLTGERLFWLFFSRYRLRIERFFGFSDVYISFDGERDAVRVARLFKALV